MRARTLLYEFMIASPVILLTAIGVQTRTYSDSYEFPHYSPQLESDIRAYTEVLRLAEVAEQTAGSATHADITRQAAMAWVEQSRTGRLKPLEPEFLTDTINEGVKQQIFTACMGLCSDLMSQSRDSAKEKQYDSAAQDLALAIETLQSLKYSDLLSASTIATRQRGILRMMKDYLPELSADAKGKIVERLARIEQSEAPIEPLLDRARGLFAQAKKQEKNHPTQETFSKLVQDAGVTDPNAIQVLAEPPAPGSHTPSKTWNANWTEGRYIYLTVALQRQMNRELIHDIRNQLASKS